MEILTFGVNLTTLTEYLNSFIDNNSSSLKMIYYGDGSPLVLILNQNDTPLDEEDMNEDDGPIGDIITEYLLKTKNTDELVDFNIADQVKCNNFIMNGADFFEILNDIDRSIDELEIMVSG